jgi:hypothetical protein
LHDRHFGEARNDELAGFIQFLIAHSRSDRRILSRRGFFAKRGP